MTAPLCATGAVVGEERVTAALHATGVSVRIGGRRVLCAVTCEVRPGEVLGILGPNAAGKSTLLAALAGERAPESGEVTVRGRPLGTFKPPELARIRAVVRQRPEVAFDLRVIDVVLLGRFAHPGRGDAREDRDMALAALAEVDLRGLSDRSYAHLSGGEQRRVHVARALAQVAGRGEVGEERYLLLDEPLSNLDLRHQVETLDLLRRKAAEGLGVAVVLHELGLAGRACDRLMVLHEGRAAYEGPPASVLTPEVLRRVFGVETRTRTDERAGVLIDVLGPGSGDKPERPRSSPYRSAASHASGDVAPSLDPAQSSSIAPIRNTI